LTQVVGSSPVPRSTSSVPNLSVEVAGPKSRGLSASVRALTDQESAQRRRQNAGLFTRWSTITNCCARRSSSPPDRTALTDSRVPGQEARRAGARHCRGLRGGARGFRELIEGVAHDSITAERERGMSARIIHDRVRKLKTWTRWMRKRGWTRRDRWEDVQTPRADLAEFDLIEPKLRAAAFAQFDAHTCLGARNQAILALLSDCGVRRDELCIIRTPT
jgi:hypothetical protein